MGHWLRRTFETIEFPEIQKTYYLWQIANRLRFVAYLYNKQLHQNLTLRLWDALMTQADTCKTVAVF